MREKSLVVFTALIGFLFVGCDREIIIPVSTTGTHKKVPWQQHKVEKISTKVTEEATVVDDEKIMAIDDSPASEEKIPETLASDTVTIPAPRAPVHVKRMERVHFPFSEYQSLARKGKGSIRGNIYVKNAYGKRVYGKNTRLYLNPITSYSKQWYDESYIGGYKLQKADERLYNYLRFTASDSEGAFTFHGVPSGNYYIIGTVKCSKACGFDHMKSIRIAGKVAIAGNQVVKMDLNRMID